MKWYTDKAWLPTNGALTRALLSSEIFSKGALCSTHNYLDWDAQFQHRQEENNCAKKGRRHAQFEEDVEFSIHIFQIITFIYCKRLSISIMCLF